MNNKLDNEQEKRFDDKFTTGIGGVLVSRGGTSVVAEEVRQFLADEIAMAREEGRKKEENRWINQSANEHDNRIKKEALKDFLVYMDDKGLWNSHWHREEIKSRIEYYIKECNKKI